MGPVTPLLALVETWRSSGERAEFVWAGTHRGPEASVVAAQGIRFVPLASVKAPRYVSPRWLLIPFGLVHAFVDAWRFLSAEAPDVIDAMHQLARLQPAAQALEEKLRSC